MTWRRPTYKRVDGERVDGAWCHVWRRHRWSDTYFVDDLVVFADGAIRCERQTDLAGLRRLLDSGEVVLRDPAAPPYEEPAGRWESRAGGPLTTEGFLLEVADEIEDLAGRATSADRCREAIRAYAQAPTEAARARLREAYLAIPPHRRIYCLGDMDLQDRPLRMLFTPIGERVDGDGPEATADMHQWVLDYFTRGEEGRAQERRRLAVRYADEPATPGGPAVFLSETFFPNGWPEELGRFVLCNDFLSPVRHAGDTYPSVLHGYWALSAADEADRIAVRDTPDARDAQERGGLATRRDDWASVRLAVMAGLLRAKFTQHPGLAEILLATGDAPISYTGYRDAPYWRDTLDDRGRNWMGRLLELTRAELRVERLSWPTEG